MNKFDNQQHNYSQSWSSGGGANAYAPPTASQVSVAERVAFIRKVYALFFAATLFAIGGVFIGISTPPLFWFAAQHPWVMFFMMLGGVMAAQALRHKPGINLVALFGFTTLTGVVISPLLYYVSLTNPNSILQAGLLTVGIFGGLTAYVFISNRDFSFLRGMVTVGLIVVVLAGLMNALSARWAWGLRCLWLCCCCLRASCFTTRRTSFVAIRPMNTSRARLVSTLMRSICSSRCSGF